MTAAKYASCNFNWSPSLLNCAIALRKSASIVSCVLSLVCLNSSVICLFTAAIISSLLNSANSVKGLTPMAVLNVIAVIPDSSSPSIASIKLSLATALGMSTRASIRLLLNNAEVAELAVLPSGTPLLLKAVGTWFKKSCILF